MEPELLTRRRPFRLEGRRIGEPLVAGCDEIDDLRWSMRLVWTFSTGVGVGVRVRRAAAAAAEERLLDEDCDWRKARVAADCADCDEEVERFGWVIFSKRFVKTN
jgi:hypothetical protein